MIVQRRACVGIHALSVCAFKDDLRGSNDLVGCLVHDLPRHFFKLSVVLRSTGPSLMYEASV